jgi:YaiO family outer membrane protein
VNIRYLLLLLLSFNCFAQKFDVDQNMREAQRHAELQDYDKALQHIDKILSRYPDDEDVLIYKARILSWKKEYTKAITLLEPLADRPDANVESVEAICSTHYWAGNYETAISYCDKYLMQNPGNTDILMIKANCLEQLGRDNEALAILDSEPVRSSNRADAIALSEVIKRRTKNSISASYLNVSTKDPGQAPFHYGYVEYARKINKTTLVGRANVGHAFDETQALFEADFYQTFKRRDYLYLNAGVSTGETVFPVARAGAEYYFAPAKRFDYSIGARYMHFKTEDVTLLTGHLGFRHAKYTFAYRPFYDTANELLSHVLSIQKDNEEKERLIRLELQYGNVPYLYLYNSFTEPLTAYRIGLQYQHRFGESFFVRPVFLYEYEEYIPENYRHKFNIQVIVTKRF